MKPSYRKYFLAALLAAPSYGAPITWDGGASPGNTWVADATNWVGDVAPVAGDSLIFAGVTNVSTVNDLTAGTNIAGITFDATAGAFTLAGNQINVSSTVVNNSTALQTISAGLTYSTTTREFNAAAGNITLSGVLASGATSGILKTGTGTLNLTGSGLIGNGGAGGIFPLNLRQGNIKIDTAGTYSVTGEAAIGDNGAGGAGNNVNLTIENGNLNISTWFSIGRGNGTGTNTSNVVLNNASKITTSSFGAGFNAGNGANQPRGSITLNNTSILEVTANNADFNFAESAGSFMTMTLNDSSQLIRTSGAVTQTKIGVLGKGILNINSSNATATIRNFIIGQGTNSVGAVYNKGTVKFNVNDGYFLGDGAGSSSYLRNDNASAATANDRANNLAVGIGNNSNAVVDVISGTLPVGNLFAGPYNSTNATNGQVNVRGGILDANFVAVGDNNTRANKYAVFNVTGTGELRSAGAINLSQNNVASNTGILSIANGGTVTAIEITVGGTTANAIVNFDSGTLKASAAAPAVWMNAGLDGAFIHDGGATFNTNGFDKTIAANLIAPTGNGVATIPLATAGAGYVSTPLVKITGGGGTGATAVAEFDIATGTVTGITITSQGSGYTSAPTVTLLGGGATTAATLGTVTTAAVTGGGIVKTGSGVLTVTGANNYTGNTVINQGTLEANRSNNVFNPTSSALGNPQVANSIIVNNGGILKFSNGDTLGGATSTVQSKLVINQGGLTTNNGISFTRLGSVDLNGGTLESTGGPVAGYQAYSFSPGAIITVGGTAASTISGTGSFGNYHLNTNTSFVVGDSTSSAATDLLVSGILINRNDSEGGAGGLTKSGLGTMELTATNLYTGPTNIAAGRLVIGSTGSIATSSTINLSLGATLDVSNVAGWSLGAAQTMSGSGSVVGSASFPVGSILAPGNSVGTLSFGSNLTLAGTSYFEVDPTNLTSDLAAVTGTLNFGGTLNVTLLGPDAFAEGQQFTLFSFAGSSGTFSSVNLPTLSGSLTWDQSSLYTAGIIAVVPEASSTLLGALGIALAFGRRKRAAK